MSRHRLPSTSSIKKRAGDLRCRETADHSQRESDLRRATQRRVTARKNESKPVVRPLFAFDERAIGDERLAATVQADR